MKRILLSALAVAPLVLAAQPLNKPKINLNNWATGLTEPVALANAGDSRMFVVERAGVIKIISDSMTVLSRPFLNISGPVQSAGGEQGLLGLAFAPDYATSGYFYLYYIFGSGAGQSRISRWQVSSDPDSADTASEEVVYSVPQPYSNHNGGDIHFGPDGYLYIAFGDGGSGNDPENSGQSLNEPLGDMLRIDVSDPGTTYTIPPTNPWQNNGDTLPEIWASGLRNPWRWGFDRLTGDMWMGDVGQNAWEEIDFWPAGDNSGPNFGWVCREGLVATPGVSQANCGSASDYIGPTSVHSHGDGWCSVIGGRVYRGSWYPHLYGQYIFTDYCAGDFLTYGAGSNYDVDTMLLTTNAGYAAFGEDMDGELYVADQANGRVRKIYDACPMADPVITSEGDVLTATDGTTYQWYLDGVAISGATGQSYIAPVSGNYQVRVNFGTPCNLWSDTLTFIVTGLDEEHIGGLMVFPQPAAASVILERGNAAGAWSLEVFDAAGRVALSNSWPVGGARTMVDVSALPNGHYTVRCMDVLGATVARKPLVIAR